MNLKEIESLMIWIDAIKLGKTIQSKYKFGFNGDKWFDVNAENFNWAHASKHEFRIKPEPKLRPWRPEEVPVGALNKRKDGTNYAGLFLGFKRIKGKMLVKLTNSSQSLDWCFENLIYSTDGGKTWNTCGIQE